MTLKPWQWVSPQLGHQLAPIGTKLLAQFFGHRAPIWRPVTWRGLSFPNPVGTAGGLDKEGVNVLHWPRLGAGFVEIGTVTPRPQDPNPGTILDRNLAELALWNKMGFPNSGAHAARDRIAKIPKQERPIIFLNVGKNRETSNETAAQDYLEAMTILDDCADVFVINISSPNTTSLRELLLPKNLRPFLQKILSSGKFKQPLLLKLSPDLDQQQLCEVITTAVDLGISGFTISNTLINRQNIFKNRDGGGVSGLPLRTRSFELLKSAKAELVKLKSDAILVSVGGVMGYKDIAERLDAGATLVQVYSAIVFEGPLFFRNVAREAAWP